MGKEGAATTSSRLKVPLSTVGATPKFAVVDLSSNTVQPLPQAPAVPPLAATVTRESAPRLEASERARLKDTWRAEDAADSRLLRISSRKEGAAKAPKIAIIATTTIVSISVNPPKALFFDLARTNRLLRCSNGWELHVELILKWYAEREIHTWQCRRTVKPKGRAADV